ncbi:class I SAM-dependent methyltransferase [Chromobacterium vaccinii]|uniref:class I SAM-dependent methyltransferase n=1 Tax=Chromobacterium vaccinii TaxID=1108595 RepID=UPI000CE9A5AF|nr:class I SAM-dependent methyltransferase [Chromobacterium vaccinii]AVG15115.1 SAM-dependent methyltransferase [Chromobacterium vaccinii]MCD4483115.1 class I SAM-dependent methyltransferase [Chromobacterium vaccinii]MCD4498596.1 class I SAM-dependent methyltransferase [Chromobacterium vaccinii]
MNRDDDGYAERVAFYDTVYEQPERALDLAWLRRWLPQQYFGRRVLELACGSGYWTQYLAPAARAYLALDVSPGALALAGQRPGVGGVAFAAAEIEALPKPAEPFDAAFAGLWFSHLPRQRREAALAALHGCLAPGATVILLDNSEIQGGQFPVMEYDEAGNGYQRRPRHDGGESRVLKNFPTEAEFRILLAPYGAAEMALLRREHFWLLRYRLPSRH